MTDFTTQSWPRLWPVGARLRFKRNAKMYPQFSYLRGTPVLVLNEARDFRDQNAGARQMIYAFAAASADQHVGWARPDQLEPIPDEADENDASTLTSDGAADGWTATYPVRECRIGVPEQVEKCP